MFAVNFGPLAFGAPWALALLPAPLLLAWWLARAAGARPEPTGSVELWREAVRDAPQSARRAWNWPARTLAAVAALLFAVFALSQPVHLPAESAVKWIAIVDASASMSRGYGVDSNLGARAVDATEQMLERISRPGDTVEWRLVSGSHVIESAVESPLHDGRHVQLARRALARPDWRHFDAPGVIWVTYDAEGLAPARAGLVAPEVVPREGEFANWPSAALLWSPSDRADVVPRTAPRVAMRAADWESEIGRIVAAWAQARGLEAVQDEALDEESFELVVSLAAAPGDVSARGSRDGWTLFGPFSALAPTRWPSAVWLSDVSDATRALVRIERGRVDCAFTARHELAGDAAAFAVSWSEMLDGALLPVEATFPQAILRARSERVELDPRRPAPAQGDETPLAHVFAAAASALALLAAFLKH